MIMPMSRDQLTFIKRTGGLTVYLVGENTAGTDSEPTWANIDLNAKEWGTLTYIPRTLEEDAAVEVGELVAFEIAQAFAEKMDDIGFNGDGTSTYFGIRGLRSALGDINGVDDGGGLVLGAGNAYSELTDANFLKCMGILPTYAETDPSWYVTTNDAVVRPVQQWVSMRRFADGVLPPLDGSLDGFLPMDNILCERIRWQTGPAVGYAKLTYVPLTSADQAVEDIAAQFTPDDHVQVRVLPIDDELVEQPEEENQVAVMFEGYIARVVAEMQGASGGGGGDSREQVTFTALPLARLDNEQSDHLVTGRWMYDPAGTGATTVFVAETPGLPAIFNFRGRPNMSAAAAAVVTATHTTGVTMTTPLFTHDDDTAGLFWRLGDALGSIMVMWLYGRSTSPLSRHIDLEVATWNAIAAALSGTDGTGAFEGMTRRLPEVNVHGLGVLDALQAVCAAGGFEFACEPALAETDVDIDRRHVLRIWRRGSGRASTLEMDKRGTTYTSAEDQAKVAREEKVVAMLDASGIRNEVFARARQFLEVRLAVKPLWDPTLTDTSTIDATLQDTPTTVLKTTNSYYRKHVYGGNQFDTHGQIGRIWGLDCLGTFTIGYSHGGVYDHGGAAFDFVATLGLDAASAITAERTDNGVTDAIQWSRRLRRALPLRSSAAKALGIPFVLEVSEDAGSTWTAVNIGYSSLSDFFGIQITGVSNLAGVNKDTINTTDKPAPAASWWGLIATKQLLFRLTCVIEADHATRYDATRRSTSRTRLRRGEYMALTSQETWVQPGTTYNSGGGTDWVKVPGWGTATAGVDPEKLVNVRAAAEQRRDKLEDLRVSAASTTWLFDLDRFKLGDRITGIRKRNLSLSANAGSEQRSPTVRSIDYVLAPGGQQGIRLNLDDMAMTGDA